jgi:hypothetical protein
MNRNAFAGSRPTALTFGHCMNDQSERLSDTVLKLHRICTKSLEKLVGVAGFAIASSNH